MELHDLLKQRPPSHLVTETLMSDMHECGNRLDELPNSQFWRRSYIRTAYALIEGVNNYQRQEVFSFHERSVRPLYNLFRALDLPSHSPIFAQIQSEVELLLLLDKSATLDRDGKCQLKDSFCPTAAAIKFMFAMSSRIYQTGFVPDYSDSGWRDLKQGVLIRNRLTHPKTSFELDVLDGECDLVKKGAQWYLDTTGKAMFREGEALRQHQESMTEFFRTLSPEKFKAFQAVVHLLRPSE